MDYILIGKFEGTHGLKGEIKLNSKFNYINNTLKENFNFYIGKNKNKETLISNRYHKQKYLMKFKGLEDISLIEKYINQKVYVLREDLNLKEGEMLNEDYIGLNCIYNEKTIGVITEVIDTGNNNYVLIIEKPKEILIPLNKHFIKEIKDKNLYLDNMEGLINEN